MKTKSHLFLLVTFLICSSRSTLAQPVLDSFDPNVEGLFGVAVRKIVVQPDGKVLVGGLFNSVAPNGGPSVARTNIARFNSDGSLDTNFDGNANSDIYAIAIQPDGKILVGGYFTRIGGQFRNRIARLDPTNGLADSFNPGANEIVRTIVVQTNGMILVGGGFSNIGGTNRSCIARLDPISGLADSFNPSATSESSVYSIAIQNDNKILIGGTFTSIAGTNRNRIARLDPTSGLADSLDPNADSDVLSLALQSDGKIVAGGFFNNVGGQPRNCIARIDSTNGLADSFNPNANTTVQTVVVQTDGKILAGGGFTFIGGQSRGRFARLDTNGVADSFDPNAGGTVSTIALQTDGKIVAGGTFTTMSTQPRGRVARFATPQPILNIQRVANTNVVLSWATNLTSFTLEANTNLSTNVWSVVSPAPAVSGTNNVVTNNINGQARFYRLRQ
ncbi:MAG: delta-60 repeat domain-containing protein [Verrucomicrobiota bacterium]